MRRPPRWTWLIVLVVALLDLALAITGNVAASLVPLSWSQGHPWLVWGSVVLLFAGSLALRRWGLTEQNEPTTHIEAGGPGAQAIGTVTGGMVHGPRTAVHAPYIEAAPGAVVNVTMDQAPSGTSSPDALLFGRVPAQPRHFVPRGEVARATEALEHGQVALVALHGMRGVGKTVVAGEIARAAHARGIPIVAWVSGEDRDTLVRDLSDLARELGVSDPDRDDLTSARRAVHHLQSSDRDSLLVIDNATAAAHAEDLTPAGRCRVLFTTTEESFGQTAGPVRVDVYDDDEALAYLLEATGRTDRDGAAVVCRVLGNSPLGLAAAAAYLGQLPSVTLEEYAALLERGELAKVLPATTAYGRTIAEAILQSVAVVENHPAVAETLTALALGDAGGMSLAILAHVVSPPNLSTVREAGGALVHSSLAQWSETGDALVIHGVTGLVLRDRLRVLHEDVTARWVLLGALGRAAKVEGPDWPHRPLLAEVADHLTAAIAGLTPAELTDIDESILRAPVHLVWRLQEVAEAGRAITVGRGLGDLAERVLGSDHPATLTSRNNLAGAYESAGDLTRAIPLYEATLADRERVLGPVHPDTLTSRNDLAAAYHAAGDLTRAIPLYEEAVKECRKVLSPGHPTMAVIEANLKAALESQRRQRGQ